MSKKGESEYTSVNPNQLTRFTLNPAAHFSEVDTERYHDGKLIRSTFDNRIVDTFLYLSGVFYKDPETGEVVGGKAGVLDFIIPHYFVYRAWLWWTKDPARAWAGFIITIPLGILRLGLALTKYVLSFSITLVSMPLLGLAHLVYLGKYLVIKDEIKKLLITTDDPTHIEEPQQSETEESSTESTLEAVTEPEPVKPVKKQNILSYFIMHEVEKKETKPVPPPSKVTPKKDKKPAKIVEEKPLVLFPLKKGFISTETEHYRRFGDTSPHLIEHVHTFRLFFSNMNSKTELVEDKKHDLFIKVTKKPEYNLSDKKDKIFFIKVDPDNPQPLREALHLNIFGITSALENKKNNQGQSDLARVEEVLASKQ